MTDRNLSDKRTFYTIPNSNIHPEKKEFTSTMAPQHWYLMECQELQSFFIFKRVCEDHFEVSCFLDDITKTS